MRLVLLCLLACAVSMTSAQELYSIDYQIKKRGIQDYEILRFDSESIHSTPSRDEFQSFDFQISADELIRIHIEEYDLRSPHYIVKDQTEVQRRSSTVKTYRGYTDDGSQVRLTLDRQFAYGYIEHQQETYWIEPTWYYDETSPKSDMIIVYKSSDIDDQREHTCGATETAKKIDQLNQNRSNSRIGQCYTVELAIASDFSIYTKYNSSIADVEAHNMAVINNVNGDYTGSFGDDIEFSIVTQWISTCSTCDPWSNSTDPNILLNSFTNWGSGGGGFGVNHDLGELWTNRDFDGTTIGIAWVGVVCTNIRYHCLQDFSGNANLLRVVTSHEIGHNFNADHTQNGFIMGPSVSNTSSWHSDAVSQITNFITAVANLGGCFLACASGALPSVDMEALSSSICDGTTIKFFDRTTESPFGWIWTFPGGDPGISFDQHPTVTYDFPGIFSVTLEATNAAGSSTRVFTNAVSVGGVGESFPLYDDFDDGLFNWSVENPDNSTTWSISSPVAPGGSSVAVMNNFNYNGIGQRDGLISPQFSLAGYQAATVHVEYAYALAGGASDSLVVYISADNGASFQRIYGGADNGSGNFATRTPLASSFTPFSLADWCGSGGFGANCLDVDITSYLGQRDLLLKLENFNNSSNNLYLDRVYVSTNCFDLPPPVADFTADLTQGCAPLVIQFQDLSQNSPFEWLWTFENGSPSNSTGANPEVIFSTPGIYTVTLTVTNETGINVNTKAGYIQVIGDPVAAFSVMNNGNTVSFINLSVDADSYDWDFGDGEVSTDDNPVHVYDNDGVYQVVLTVTNACGSDEITIPVTVGTIPVASYDGAPLSGCLPLQVQFVSTSSANAIDLLWFFDGGLPATSIATNPLVTYTDAGSYTVTLIATNGTGSDTLISMNEVIVDAAVIADFDFVPSGLDLMFTNTTVYGTSYQWDFGDGEFSTDLHPSHQYNIYDVFEIILIASNSCSSDTSSQIISLVNAPNSSFTASAHSICLPESVTFHLDQVGPSDVVAWNFEGGSPSTSSDTSPVVIYNVAGVFDVTCVVTNMLGSDTTHVLDEISVGEGPMADFEVNDTILLNLSANATEYAWFIDGQFVSNEEDYNFTLVDDFVATLIATNNCGADTLTIDVILSANENIPVFHEGMTLVPNPSNGQFQIQFDRAVSDFDLEIFDVQGRRVYQIKEYGTCDHYELTVVSKGLHIVRISTEKAIYIGKLLLVE